MTGWSCLGYAKLGASNARRGAILAQDVPHPVPKSNQMPATIIDHDTIATISKSVQVLKCYQALTSVAAALGAAATQWFRQPTPFRHMPITTSSDYRSQGGT